VKREDGKQHPASWPEAIGSAAVALQRVKEQHGGQAIGVIGGRNLTNEDCYALARFASEVLETPHVDHRIGARSLAANPLAPFGLDAFNSQFADVENADAILLVGSDVYEEMPVFWLRIRKAVTKGAKLFVANPRATEADRIAFRRLRHRPGEEAAVARALSGDAGASTSLDPDLIRFTADLLKDAKRPFIYAGARLATRDDSGEIAAALLALAESLGHRDAVNYFCEGANARGAAFAGLVPGEGGLPAGEIIAAAADGRIKALYLVGENVIQTHPDLQQAQRALETAEVVIVHELFPTATAEHADIVFAATGLPEKDGSLTNAEGRLQRLFQALRPAPSTRPDWRILTDLSSEMGASLGYAAASEITRDVLQDLPVYASSNGTIPPEGLVCREHPTPAEGASSEARAQRPPATGELQLITWSELLGHETMVAQTPELLQLVPHPYVELNAADAQRLHIEDGQLVRLTTQRGSLERTAKVNRRCPEGTCFTPDNIGSPRINVILDWNTPLPTVTLTKAQVPQVAAT
jgi:predicted molibdopterin-dependent oxidoreductase YjgC